MVKIVYFYCKGHMFHPWHRNKDPACCIVMLKNSGKGWGGE